MLTRELVSLKMTMASGEIRLMKSDTMERLCSTLSMKEAANIHWSAVIVGAGVAGAAAAIHCGQAGVKTLLVEAKSMPREKVCGGCLNQRAQTALKKLGVFDRLIEKGAKWIDEIEIRTRRKSVIWRIPKILSVRRSTLDSILIQRAIEVGVEFLSETMGKLPDTSLPDVTLDWSQQCRRVLLSKTTFKKEDTDPETGLPIDGDEVAKVDCLTNCVLVADGLSHSALAGQKQFVSLVDPNSRIGVQAIDRRSSWLDRSISSDRLTMLVGTDGYVGVSPTDGEMVDIAAAVDPTKLGPSNRPSHLVEQIMTECGVDGSDLANLGWKATPALTRHSLNYAGPRLFLLGDATGYVEPFTGEGMSWALASADAVVPYVIGCDSEWKNNFVKEWDHWVQWNAMKRQRTCRRIVPWTRNTVTATFMLHLCSWIPPLRWKWMNSVSR